MFFLLHLRRNNIEDTPALHRLEQAQEFVPVFFLTQNTIIPIYILYLIIY